MRIKTSSPYLIGVAAVVAAGALALAGCASSGTTTTATQAADSGTTQDSGSMSQMGQGGGGTAGEIVQLTDTGFYLQGSDSQTTVTTDSSTTYTETVDGSLKDVEVGSCVVAFSAGTSDSDASSTTAVTTVSVSSAADDGTCSTGFGGGSGGSFPGGSGTMPTDLPTDGSFSGGMGGSVPSDFPTDGSGMSGTGGGFGGASGEVTAVDGDTITIETTAQDGTTSSSTVTVDSSTTYSVQKSAKASAVDTGLCATVQGDSDSSGGITATSVALSAKGDDGCSTGFGGMGQRANG